MCLAFLSPINRSQSDWVYRKLVLVIVDNELKAQLLNIFIGYVVNTLFTRFREVDFIRCFWWLDVIIFDAGEMLFR